MATFSASPAPRRSSRLGGPANSPPGAASRRLRVGSSRPTSRLGTPVRPAPERLPVINDNISVGSGMDVDEGSIPDHAGRMETLFAKSEEMSVAFHAHLPVEVKQVLKNADFYTESYSGDVDTLTGFALIASSRTCFVWQHAHAVKGTPTCYIFSCPGSYTHNAAPYHKLVPYVPTREPGLILISISGEVRFWDSIGIGLAGGDHYSTTCLDLGSREIVTNLIRADAQTYIASTSTGRLFRLVLTSTGGKHHVTSHPFSQTLGNSLSLARLIPGLWSSPSSLIPQGGNANAVAIGQASEVWALVDTRLQKWTMSLEGWEEVTLDEDLAGIVAPAVRDAFLTAPQDSLDLELLDLAVESSGKLVILASYAGIEDKTGMDVIEPRRIYALLRISHGLGSFEVENTSGVPYQSTSTSGAPMHPRIRLMQGGFLVSIQFGDAVILCARDSEYYTRLELKSATDRTLGVGITEDESTFLVLTSAIMMKGYMDMDLVASFNPVTGRANQIKSTMTQAILYGSNPENPLHFSLPPEIEEGSLMQGAEQLSQAVLESDSEVVRRNHDLNYQMTGRKERLSWLIGFINDNSALTKMSQKSRQRLATDAEKLYSCHQLWLRHNDLLANGQVHSVLNEAVCGYMNEVGEGHHEDFMRAFFRLRVHDIGNLLPRVADIIAKATRDAGRNMSSMLPEANEVVLTVLESSLEYRKFNLPIYGVTLPIILPWSSEPSIIDAVLELFYTTTRFVEHADPDQGSSEPSLQLPRLASTLFAAILERLDWLGSIVAPTEPGADLERKQLDDKFQQLRPEVLETLRRNDHTSYAFKLAEDYHDFRTLATLCHKDSVYPSHKNPHALRIQTFVEKYREEFTTELYQWYIEHGELRVMFEQEDMYSGYMDKFFATSPHPSISWIHDLGKDRHGAASATLLSEAENTGDLEIRHLMLSIGKLSHLAQFHDAETSIDQMVLDSFHDGLDFVSVHKALVDEFKSALTSGRGRQSLDFQIDAIIKAKASKICDSPPLLIVFRGFVRQLLQGKLLSVEDAVDVLTMKDNDTTARDFVAAIHLLSRDEKLPAVRRQSSLRSIWRRIYLHDDWDTIRQTRDITDFELNERFKRTALYVALHEMLHEDEKPGHHLTMHETFPIPTHAEISSRWPGMSQELVYELSSEYQSQAGRLMDLALDDVYDRIKEIALQDVFDS